MRVLSLFSGGGLGDYGLELAGMEIVGQVEIDDYCQRILKLRWPEVSKWRDIKDFDGHAFVREHGQPDVISGGFPCQDISIVKVGKGISGERSGLWKEMLRVIQEIRPKYCLVENVSAIISRGLGTVLSDLVQIGYDAEWDCFPASIIGAPHRRERVFILAYPSCREPQTRLSWGTQESLSSFREYCENEVWDSSREKTALTSTLSGMANGLAGRVDRLKLLGNGQVVQVVQWIGDRIMEFDTQTKRKGK